jgi:hypothetical protein
MNICIRSIGLLGLSALVFGTLAHCSGDDTTGATNAGGSGGAGGSDASSTNSSGGSANPGGAGGTGEGAGNPQGGGGAGGGAEGGGGAGVGGGGGAGVGGGGGAGVGGGGGAGVGGGGGAGGGAAPGCGDDVLDIGEACDDGNTETELVCASPANACVICKADCTGEVAISARQPAVSFTTAQFDHFADDVTGFKFTVGANAIVVSQLGFYDEGKNGLGDAHDVGIFDPATGQLVVGGQVPAGTAVPESGGFRYVDVAPTVLNAGTTYSMLGYRPTAADGIAFFSPDFAAAPFITYESDLALNGTGGLVFTDASFGLPTSWFGPSFTATVLTPQ